MVARIPQDVDLEDNLVYGLSPIRFGYLAVAAVGALTLWNLHQLPAAVRGLLCALLLGVGVAVAWGRWRGRPVDLTVVDAAVFGRRNFELRLARPGAGGARAAPMEAAFGWINRLTPAHS
ncbi:MAG: hypothetical protein M3024_15710 [Candidatus Dormibacteraeota bacterium]|nr:hypothetical protein [Candidatus Dormibacteraeota bacterium]